MRGRQVITVKLEGCSIPLYVTDEVAKMMNLKQGDLVDNQQFARMTRISLARCREEMRAASSGAN